MGPQLCGQLIFEEGGKEYSIEKKTVSSTNGVAKTGEQYGKEWNWPPYIIHTKKFKMDDRPKCEIEKHQKS